ncbi:MAG: InlB B-repeat-containing protein [Clostridiales bacterium]|nr:InlB B-repeat-containing protein [Clostridiales bacterium]
MKKLHRVVLAALFAVMLALGAFGFAACSNANDNASKSEYTMTFMIGTMMYDSVTTTEGSSYKMKEEAPYRVNNVFEGWSRTENGPVEDLPATMPSENRTYYAVFSAQFALRLNAGAGAIPEDQKTMSVKVGDDLYTKLSDITPTISDGDATFVGWYLNGNVKIEQGADVKMPGNNVEVVAKYEVSYTVNVYKELDLNSNDYPSTPVTITGKGTVGEKLSGLPAYTGFHYDTDHDNTALTETLGKNSAQNVLSVYYEYIPYDADFSVNLPAGVAFEGDAQTMACGYQLPNEAPACKYTADGYRFVGWATTADGDVAYYPGDEFSIERSTIFYAKWVKGLVDLTGRSSDRVYIMGKVEDPTVTVAYLERVGLKDILGTYDKATHVFEFKSVLNKDSDDVLLRGIADTTRSMYTYLNTDNATVYTLLDAEGDNVPTITLNDNGNAQYVNAAGDTQTGKYVGDTDGSLLFVVDGDTKFAFRLVMSDTGIASYEVRGEEYGLWYTMSQAGVVRTSQQLLLDGYGAARMAVYDNSGSSAGYKYFGGRYILNTGEGAYDGDDGVEIVVQIFNSSLNYRFYTYLLSQATVQTTSGVQKVNVFTERFKATLYGAPADGETLDTETADKIELSGYGMLDGSATYTKGSTTVTGKYVYDSTYGTITIIPATGDNLVFEIQGTYGEGDNAVPVFELQGAECGTYGVSNLLSNAYYTMAVYNNNTAALYFRLSIPDQFYGTVSNEYVMVLAGEYELIKAGSNGDVTGNLYEFTAQINEYTLRWISVFANSGVNLSPCLKFKFQFVYNNGKITSISVTQASDALEGATFTYDGVKYTLDGYGTAVSQDDDNVKKTYKYSNGMLTVNTPTAEDAKATTVFYDYDGDSDFAYMTDNIVVANSEHLLAVRFMSDGTAVLLLYVQQDGMLIAAYPVSFGIVVWNDDDKTAGSFVRDEQVVFSYVYSSLAVTYEEFDFSIVTTTNTNDKGETVTTKLLYIDYAGTTQPTDGKYDILNAAGDKLILDVNASTAKYVKKGKAGENDTEYEGHYVYSNGNIIQFADTKGTLSLTLRLIYTDGAISSFETVGYEVGYAVSYDDARNYLYLSGNTAGTDKVYSGTYYVYDAETGSNVPYEGTYRANQYGVEGYDFTYTVGGEQVTFTFNLYREQRGFTFFRTYRPTAQYTVYTMTMSNLGNPTPVALIGGGGYSNYVLQLSQTNSATGNFEKFNDESDIYVFTMSSNGSKLYFQRIEAGVLFYLDGTYIPEIDGVFELPDPIELTVAGTPGTMETPAVPEHTASISSVRFTGYVIAEMYYTYNGEEKTIQAFYVQVASSTYMLLDNKGNMLARVRLMYRTNQDGTREYFAQTCDMDYYGLFVSNENTVVNLNGFDSAVYVDSYGRVHSGSYTMDDGVLCISYIDNYTVVKVYLTVDTEKGTFTLVPAPTAGND